MKWLPSFGVWWGLDIGCIQITYKQTNIQPKNDAVYHTNEGHTKFNAVWANQMCTLYHNSCKALLFTRSFSGKSVKFCAANKMFTMCSSEKNSSSKHFLLAKLTIKISYKHPVCTVCPFKGNNHRIFRISATQRVSTHHILSVFSHALRTFSIPFIYYTERRNYILSDPDCVLRIFANLLLEFIIIIWPFSFAFLFCYFSPFLFADFLWLAYYSPQTLWIIIFFGLLLTCILDVSVRSATKMIRRECEQNRDG